MQSGRSFASARAVFLMCPKGCFFTAADSVSRLETVFLPDFPVPTTLFAISSPLFPIACWKFSNYIILRFLTIRKDKETTGEVAQLPDFAFFPTL
jgi:hypothetical protein